MSNHTITSEIDRALAASRARVAAKKAAALKESAAPTSDITKQIKATKTPEQLKARDDERTAKKEAAEAARESRRVIREAERAQKKAERDAERSNTVPHMAKVEKAAARLPALTEAAQNTLESLKNAFERSELEKIAAHLVHFSRERATVGALAQKLLVGDSVRITGGDVRFIGTVGTVEKVNRIRCFVEVGLARPLYLFTSDVEKIESIEDTSEETFETSETQEETQEPQTIEDAVQEMSETQVETAEAV